MIDREPSNAARSCGASLMTTLELLTRRDRGETVYLARKRPPAAGS